MSLRPLILTVMLVVSTSGCTSSEPHLDQFGRVYFFDGAGNWDYLTFPLKAQLKKQGYKGNVIYRGWTRTLNPFLDETCGRIWIDGVADQVVKEIEIYRNQYDAPIDIIGFSAGSLSAVRVCEKIKIRHLVLLGSSLAYRYDLTDALKNVDHCWIYKSSRDSVLKTLVPLFGTIDGRNDKPLGLMGYQSKDQKVHNIKWSIMDLVDHGWTGEHYSFPPLDYISN